jgi:hypothetical protein
MWTNMPTLEDSNLEGASGIRQLTVILASASRASGSRDAGFIDAPGVRRVVLDGNPDREMWEQKLRAAGTSEPAAVFDGLLQAWAVHLMRREFGELQLAFFERALSTD